MRALATLVAAALALSSSGVEWLDCERAAGHDETLAAEDEHGDEHDDPCGPSSPECSCCFNLRLALPDTRLTFLEPAPEARVWVTVDGSVPDPAPGEILHVPRAS